MRTPVLIFGLAALSACSGADSGGDSGDAAAGGDFRALAECSARMDAVSNLYAAIADTTGNSEMTSTAELRAAAARVLKAEAEKVAGDASAEVEKIIGETKAAIDAEQQKREFEDFGAWVGQQADGCASIVQEIVKKSAP